MVQAKGDVWQKLKSKDLYSHLDKSDLKDFCLSTNENQSQAHCEDKKSLISVYIKVNLSDIYNILKKKIHSHVIHRVLQRIWIAKLKLTKLHNNLLPLHCSPFCATNMQEEDMSGVLVWVFLGKGGGGGVCLSQSSHLHHVTATHGKQGNSVCTCTTYALQTVQTCSSGSSCREPTITGSTLRQEIRSVKIPANKDLSPAVELCFTYFSGVHWMLTTFKLIFTLTLDQGALCNL